MVMMSLFLGVGFLAIASAYVNIALNKPANLQYPLIPDDNTHNANNAVDGRKSNLTWDGGQCSASAARETATWWVNLTDIRSIHHITIYYMVGQRPWGASSLFTPSFLGLSVYVSNTADKLQGTLCFKDDMFTIDTIPAILTITCPTHGQYVIYYNERLPGVTYPKGYSSFAQSDLCEVEVYGCHTTGYYGLNCSIPCPHVNCQHCHIETGNCQGCKPGYRGQHCDTVCPHGFFGQNCAKECNRTCAGCNSVDGSCDLGCIPGYTGYYCNKRDDVSVCKKGSYGINCNESCGHCRDMNQCSHINGTCLTGCESGFRGDLCKTPCVKTANVKNSEVNGKIIAVIIILILAFVILILYLRL